jgi:hypothetical protein
MSSFALPVGGNYQAVQALRPSETIKVSITVNSLTSPVLVQGVYRVYADVDCFLSVGSNPTASAAEMPLAASAREYFAIFQADRIAVIRAASDGTLSITRMR